MSFRHDEGNMDVKIRADKIGLSDKSRFDHFVGLLYFYYCRQMMLTICPFSDKKKCIWFYKHLYICGIIFEY